MNVLHLAPSREPCGIARYNDLFVAEMARLGVAGQVFRLSPNQIRDLPATAFRAVERELADTAGRFDLVHIQHEFSFFTACRLRRLVSGIRRVRPGRLVATIHTTPPWLAGVPTRFHSIRSRLVNLGVHHHNRSTRRAVEPLRLADRVIVHSEGARHRLTADCGFPPGRLRLMDLPVKSGPPVVEGLADRERLAAVGLVTAEGDRLVGLTGFLNPLKGHAQAIKALSFLPGTVKLLILGGPHPVIRTSGYLDELADLIRTLGLQERVAITGYVSDAAYLPLLACCDVVVYPYHPEYPSASAALNDAIAVGRPAVAYPTPAFRDLHRRYGWPRLCETGAYYELQREIGQMLADPDRRTDQLARMRVFQAENAYPRAAQRVVDLYCELTGGG